MHRSSLSPVARSTGRTNEPRNEREQTKRTVGLTGRAYTIIYHPSSSRPACINGRTDGATVRARSLIPVRPSTRDAIYSIVFPCFHSYRDRYRETSPRAASLASVLKRSLHATEILTFDEFRPSRLPFAIRAFFLLSAVALRIGGGCIKQRTDRQRYCQYHRHYGVIFTFDLLSLDNRRAVTVRRRPSRKSSTFTRIALSDIQAYFISLLCI